jgi:hypothetical protein
MSETVPSDGYQYFHQPLGEFNQIDHTAAESLKVGERTEGVERDCGIYFRPAAADKVSNRLGLQSLYPLPPNNLRWSLDGFISKDAVVVELPEPFVSVPISRSSIG